MVSGDCPRIKDGTLDRQYKRRCQQELEEEDDIIRTQYSGDRDAYVKALADIPNAHVQIADLFDNPSYTKYRNQILNGETAKALNWMKNVSLGPIERGVLAELSFQVLADTCSDGKCDATWTTKGDANAKQNWTIIKKEYDGLLQAAKGPNLLFHPLYAAQIFEELVNSEVDANVFVPFDPSEYSTFIRHFTERLDENEQSWVPKQPVLLYSFLMDEENFAVIVDKFEFISKRLQDYFEDLIDNQYNFPGKRLQKTAFDKLDALKKQGHDIKELVADKTQGIALSDVGNTLLTLYLGLVVEQARNDGPLSTFLKLDESSMSVEDMFVQAYVFICREQEKRLKAYKETTPYTFSEFGKGKKVWFPRLLHHVPQSLSELNIRTENGKPFCSACQKGYTTYYGSTWYLQNKVREDIKWNEDETLVVSGGNDRGLCVQLLDDLLREAGIDPNAESNNPWYIDFVGTWQQAQKRLDAYKAKQQEMYDSNDPRYSWVEYYWHWLILKVDLVIKKLAGISDVEPSVDLPAPELEEQNEWGEWVLGGFKKFYVFLKEAAKLSGVLLYKVIALILNSPMTQELVIRGIKNMKENLCRRVAIHQGKVDMVKSTNEKNEDGTPVLETFNRETGEWFKATKEQRKAWTKKDEDITSAWWKDAAFTFFNALSESGAAGGSWQKFFEGGTLFYGKGLDAFISSFESVPFLGPILTKAGGVDTIKPIIIGTLVAQGDKAWQELVAANKKVSQLIRLYQAVFMGASDCLTSGRLVIKDGAELGSTAYYKDAFLHAQFNIPYYAIIVLNEVATAKEQGRDVDVDEIIETLTRTELVAGSAQRKALADQARLDQENMDQWYHEQSLIIRGKKGKAVGFDFEMDRIRQENEYHDEQRKLAEDWERKKILLGSAVVFAALVSATIATGGGAAIVAGASSAATAVGSAGSAATAMGAKAGTFVLANGGTIMNYATKVYDKVKDYPNETVMAGGLAMAGIKYVKDYVDHRNDALKILTVHEVLKQSHVRGIYFKTQLKQQIQRFRSEKETSMAKLPVLLRQKSGLLVVWAKKPMINEKEALNFFGKYGSPHVHI
tara:strand:+ start:21057 stop:24272 length:3216 start_codon:yes stop_codon:yes gene_type:complete